ncbi:MAG: acetyl-CoA carboxylase biotin carboxyl carrier protein subunit [Pseudomonas sp.]|uniref:acetyl-CoA carboxylase biotin carboxyl carrier protein n=1 Tax=Pseudomonas abieticivorans TaxID=2931382 RepID=UPI0020C0E8B4|nr:acetyl-CoA carboxylase biotin carboxyl carrier protein subunit [Pseudomonas sp. PIA16]MDE1169392.1 acetyl-CoA carboxylase biotin carboxyl carrier protein subunit [Pseudomonas sp.]
MNLQEIRQLARWLSAANLSGLQITRPGFELTLRRGSAAPAQAAVAVQTQVAAVSDAPTASVKASGPGHFFSHHPDERSAWVKAGDEVQAGQLLGVLRIGHLMLPVRSDQAGRVSAVRAAEGEQVGYGQPLFDLAV